MGGRWDGGRTGFLELNVDSPVSSLSAFLGINNTTSYLLDPRMGASIGLEEGDPPALVDALSSLVRSVVARASEALPWASLTPSVQYGQESAYFFDDHRFAGRLLAQLADPTPVIPLIHQAGAYNPLHPDFAEVLRSNAYKSASWGQPHLVVHLPVSREDQMDATVGAVTAPEVTDVLLETGVKVALENNHHASFFGYLDNFSEFFDRVGEVLRDDGREEVLRFIGACYDHGHLVAHGQQVGADLGEIRRSLLRFLAEKGHLVSVVHVHVNDGAWDHHLFLGERPPAGATFHGHPLDFDRLEANEALLLEALPMLSCPLDPPRAFVVEKDHPYAVEDAWRNYELLLGALAGRRVALTKKEDAFQN
ncbi:MAG: hypothetical protein Kow0069_16650 [Promethearchaeota archaeon]